MSELTDKLRAVDLTREAVTELADGDERIANVDLTREAVNQLADELEGNAPAPVEEPAPEVDPAG